MPDNENKKEYKKILDDKNNIIYPNREECEMSVSSWKRKESASQYLWATYQLNIRIAEIVYSLSEKSNNKVEIYIRPVVTLAAKALEYAQRANSYFISSKLSNDDFIEREKNLSNVQVSLTSLMTYFYIYIELIKRQTDMKDELARRYEGEIAFLVDGISRLISGTMRSDKERYKKMHEEK